MLKHYTIETSRHNLYDFVNVTRYSIAKIRIQSKFLCQLLFNLYYLKASSGLLY